MFSWVMIVCTPCIRSDERLEVRSRRIRNRGGISVIFPAGTSAAVAVSASYFLGNPTSNLLSASVRTPPRITLVKQDCMLSLMQRRARGIANFSKFFFLFLLLSNSGFLLVLIWPRMFTKPVPLTYFNKILWPSFQRYNQPIVDRDDILILNAEEKQEELLQKVRAQS